MNFVVTGGAGFIGSHLVEYLVKQGNSVKVIDNLQRGNLKNLQSVINNIEFFNADILNYDQLKKIIADTDGIFHQAALTSVEESLSNPKKYFATNIDGTKNILQIGFDLGIKTVFASSAAVYGNVKKIPISENDEKKPINPYGQSKLESEKIAQKFIEKGSSIVGLRYFNVYGNHQNDNYSGVISKFLNRITSEKAPIIYGDGSQIRDFIYVGDIVDANISAMKNKNSGFFNIGTGIPIRIIDLANEMISISGKSLIPNFAKANFNDILYSLASVTFAESILGWKSKTKLIDWLKKNL